MILFPLKLFVTNASSICRGTLKKRFVTFLLKEKVLPKNRDVPQKVMRGFVIVFNGAYEVASLSSRTTRSAPEASALQTGALLNPSIGLPISMPVGFAVGKAMDKSFRERKTIRYRN
jgi:hypothetical protein